MYNNSVTDNSPVLITNMNSIQSESNNWSYSNQQTDSINWSNNYQSYPSNDLTNNNYSNQAYQYYGPMYNYNSYSNYYNAFNHQQQQQQQQNNLKIPIIENTNEELLKIKQKVVDKLNIQQKIIESDSGVSSIPVGLNNTSSTSSETEASDSNKENDENSTKQENNNRSPLINNYPAFFTTQKIVNNTSKLSYTVYQLELLNAIYNDMKYPNSVQKTLIAKLIGITRDQVKIWFQNRRRKDTLVSQGKLTSTTVGKSQSVKRRKSDDEFDNNDDYAPSSPDQQNSTQPKKQVVENQVIENVLYQLKVHQNAPSRLSTKRTKLSQNESSDDITKLTQSYPVKSQYSTENNSNNRIIDLTNILNKENNQIKSETCIKSIDNQHAMENVLSSSSNNSTSTPSSFIISSTSSSSSSCSSSGTSSSEDESNHQKYIKPVKFQVLQQSFSAQDYINSRYNQNICPNKLPKLHNQFQPVQPVQPVNVYNPVYQQNYNLPNKSNNWTSSVQSYPTYQPINSNYVEQNIYNNLNGNFNPVNDQYLNQLEHQQIIPNNEYLYNNNSNLTNDQSYYISNAYNYMP